jgi:hypothetical protein
MAILSHSMVIRCKAEDKEIVGYLIYQVPVRNKETIRISTCSGCTVTAVHENPEEF